MIFHRKKEILLKGILLASSILFASIIFEFFLAPVLLSLMGKSSRQMTLLQFAAKPNTQVDDTKINSQGFTGTLLTKPKSLDTIRILTLGESFNVQSPYDRAAHQ